MTVHLAQVVGDKMDLSAALFMVDFQLGGNAPVQHLMFHPVPMDLVPPAPPAQRESLVPNSNTTQLSRAPANSMATILALLQEQKAASE